jgi:hypothetical protein
MAISNVYGKDISRLQDDALKVQLRVLSPVQQPIIVLSGEAKHGNICGKVK